MATLEAQPLREQVTQPSEPRRRIAPGYLFVIPAIVVLGITSIYPVVYSIVMSFFDWRWGNTMDFVGVENYVRLLTSSEFWQVMFQTFYFAVGAVLVEVVLGLGLALVVNRLGFGSGLIRTLLLVPLLVPGIVVSLIFKILMDSTFGIFNYMLRQLSLPTSVWLGAADSAMPSIIVIDTWWQTAFVFIILSAALKGLPQEPFEAAKVDGASGWQTFRFLTLPMLRPALLTVIIFRTIDTLKVFDIVFGTTGGGPNQATEVMQTLAYRTAFDFLQMSRSMTVMVIFAVVILVICMFYIRIGDQTTE